MCMVRSPKSLGGAVGATLGNAPYGDGDRTEGWQPRSGAAINLKLSTSGVCKPLGREKTPPVPWRSEVQILYQVITRGLHENSGACFKTDPSSRTSKNRFKEGTILTTLGFQREDRNTGSTPFGHSRPQTMSPHRALRWWQLPPMLVEMCYLRGGTNQTI